MSNPRLAKSRPMRSAICVPYTVGRRVPTSVGSLAASTPSRTPAPLSSAAEPSAFREPAWTCAIPRRIRSCRKLWKKARSSANGPPAPLRRWKIFQCATALLPVCPSAASLSKANRTAACSSLPAWPWNWVVKSWRPGQCHSGREDVVTSFGPGLMSWLGAKLCLPRSGPPWSRRRRSNPSSAICSPPTA
jgi:hypothetical protein